MHARCWSTPLPNANRGREKYAAVNLRNIKVYIHGEVATLSGEYPQTGSKDGKDISSNGLYVDTWVKRNGNWKMVSSIFHSTGSRPAVYRKTGVRSFRIINRGFAIHFTSE